MFGVLDRVFHLFTQIRIVYQKQLRGLDDTAKIFIANF